MLVSSIYGEFIYAMRRFQPFECMSLLCCDDLVSVEKSNTSCTGHICTSGRCNSNQIRTPFRHVCSFRSWVDEPTMSIQANKVGSDPAYIINVYCVHVFRGPVLYVSYECSRGAPWCSICHLDLSLHQKMNSELLRCTRNGMGRRVPC